MAFFADHESMNRIFKTSGPPRVLFIADFRGVEIVDFDPKIDIFSYFWLIFENSERRFVISEEFGLKIVHFFLNSIRLLEKTEKFRNSKKNSKNQNTPIFIFWTGKKSILYILDQNSSLISNLRPEFSKMSQKYEKISILGSKSTFSTPLKTNLNRTLGRASFLKILFIDSWSA